MRSALNIQPKLNDDERYSVFGDQGPSLEYSCQMFREGRGDQARPVTETTTEHIKEVLCLIDLTIDKIQVETGITRGGLFEYLQLGCPTYSLMRTCPTLSRKFGEISSRNMPII